jgi:hypothetical protein
MQQIKITTRLLVLSSALFLVSCNETATNPENNDKAGAPEPNNQDTISTPAYDPTMDSYNLGGDGLTKIGDTLGVKMYEFTAKPGDSWALHSHPDHTAYILQGGTVALFMSTTGRRDTITFPTGMGLISGPLSDSGRNIGNTTIRFLVTDIYRPRSK